MALISPIFAVFYPGESVLKSVFIKRIKQRVTLDPIVLKFGGSSVAKVSHWKTIAIQLKKQLSREKQPILVLSALKDVSNQLEALLHKAVNGYFQSTIDDIFEQHSLFAKQLEIEIDDELSRWKEELTLCCREIHQARIIAPKQHANVLSFGELLSTIIGSRYLEHCGFKVSTLDARKLLTSISQPDEWHHYTSASCHYDRDVKLSNQLEELSRTSSSIVVTQGFIAADKKGDTVLLGREGSDTSAAYLAAMYGAQELQIWTDVSGVFSTNPKEVTDAKQISQLSYRQAHMMAKFGAKVLHPKVIEPAEKNQISVSVRSTWKPELAGTNISNESLPINAVLAVVEVKEAIMLVFQFYEHRVGCCLIESSLSKLGFDTILHEQVRHKSYFIVTYSNTDLSCPDLDDLRQSLDAEIDAVKYHGILISIIGSRTNGHWADKALNVVGEHLSPVQWRVFREIGEERDNDRCEHTATINFFAFGDKSLELTKLLHRRLVSG